MSVSQGAFRTALLDPAAAVPEGLTDPAGRPAGKRFDVYRNNVVASLAAALETAFPVVQKLIGVQNFRVLAIEYSRAHPPSSPLMMHMGRDLPTFLEGFAPLAKYGYLPDVARLELALRESYHAADSQSIPPAALAEVPPEQLGGVRLTLAPALRLVSSPWPIVAIWRFNMADGAKPMARAETALISRPALDPQLDTLTPAEGVFVAAIADGATLEAASEAGSAADPGFSPNTPLSALLGGGAITALTTTNPTEEDPDAHVD